ncbi:hypothetical protein PRIPAC_95278 [Pristionchus pacificus]|uniref:Uncharacterized protein n=1 Tax=Pristionchus pacificus TaxID=54126 RepID=A0A2A6BK29_PRIPA|nr:hypothetical protein PRIPAC_95278 [Pristionchus pacificus]|eukprot:PDM66270.1 hypothetical protein PRIPAC_45495 [Pristionchus pacificus]
MDSEEEASGSSFPIDYHALDGRVVDWIDEESNLICDLAALDATFDICNTRESHNRLNNTDSLLYSDGLQSESNKEPNSIFLEREEEEDIEKKGKFFPSFNRNAMALSIFVVFVFSLFFEIQSNKPILTHRDDYSTSPDSFAHSAYIKDRDQAGHVHYSVHSQPYNLIFVYSHMSLRSRQWINIINKMERMTRYDRKEFGFYTCRCFDGNDSCKEIFGLQAKTPAVLFYHKGRYYHYTGRLSIDHVWSWVERMMSPVEIVYDLEDYYKKYLKYDVTFTQSSPFKKDKRMYRVNSHFQNFERVALDRMTGTPDSHRTRFFVVLNQTLAEYLKVDEPGTVLFQSTLGRYEYLEPGYTETQLASYVFHWDRSAFRVPFMYKGIHPSNRYKIQSNRYFTKITNGTTIVLFTRHDPLYYPGNDDITAFREIALEYSDCDLRPEWQWRAPKKIYHPRRYSAAMDELHSSRQVVMNEDRIVYEKIRRSETIRGCCSDINSRRSIQSLCSCCQSETGWMGDEWKCDLHSCTRSNANSSKLFESETCDLLQDDMTTDEILVKCCELASEGARPGKLIPHEEKRTRAQNQRDAFRGYLGQSLTDRRINRTGIDAPRNMTLWKYGCKIENPLRFVIVDTRRSPSLARRLGVNPTSTPRVAIVDAEEERLSFMDWQFSRQSLRLFIASFHTAETEWTPLVNGEFPLHSRPDSDAEGKVMTEGDERLRMKELDYEGLIDLTTRTVLDRDSVLFLTGGVSHAGSMVLHFHLYETMQFFREANIPIDFYSFDITRYDLPFNFKMNRFPSVYFLPADRLRPLDSFEFPSGLQFTSSNLVYYALACLSDTVRWKAVLGKGEPNHNLTRHLRVRIKKFERILRRRRRRLSCQSVKRLTSKVRANRLLLDYLHERTSDDDFPRVLVALQQAMTAFNPS